MKFWQRWKHTMIDLLWDGWCILSVVGIWPRFVEPALLKTTHVDITIPNLPTGLEGLRLVQFSDLHLSPKTSERHLEKLKRTIQELKPDMIFFTGDFLCNGVFCEGERLQRLLRSLAAPYGSFAILGNHDYGEAISVNDRGEYDVVNTTGSTLAKGLKRLFVDVPLKKRTTAKAKKVEMNHQLLTLLAETPFQLLHNTSRLVRVGEEAINICGLGEHMIGRCDPERAFETYDTSKPGVVLLHNPDGFPILKSYPGDLVLSGHTHGAQVNLPFLWKKFTYMEHPEYKRGRFDEEGKTLYVNRGIGGLIPFRWFAVPEVTLFTLRGRR